MSKKQLLYNFAAWFSFGSCLIHQSGGVCSLLPTNRKSQIFYSSSSTNPKRDISLRSSRGLLKKEVYFFNLPNSISRQRPKITFLQPKVHPIRMATHNLTACCKHRFWEILTNILQYFILRAWPRAGEPGIHVISL